MPQTDRHMGFAPRLARREEGLAMGPGAVSGMARRVADADAGSEPEDQAARRRAAFARVREIRPQLPSLISLYPHEFCPTAHSKKEIAYLVRKMRRVAKIDRTRGVAGYWAYDVARHNQLLWALRAYEDAMNLMGEDDVI